MRSRAWWRRPAAYAGAVAVIALLALGLTLRGIRGETSGLFTVWGQPLSRGAVLGEHAGPGEEVRVLVNGQPYSGDPRSVPLVAHEQIVVQLGPPFPSPQQFSFPPGS